MSPTRRGLFAFALLMAAAAPAPRAQAPANQLGSLTWTIDANHSSAQFAVRHMRVSTVRGQFGKLSGTIRMAGTDVRSIAIDAAIDVTSIDTRVASRDNDLRGPDFFDVERFPTITFVSRTSSPVDATHFRVVGDLTMHGVTREVVLDVEGPSEPVTQGQVIRVGASATTTINRRDFGLQYNRVVEGAAVVSDEVRITIDVAATRRLP